ncbi:MAG TPA: hydantoinase B/oxoprolinase family protein [Anaerolineales bacterium]|nr:hydantoinase B/oxoprolinase family protein [Anaerolineales bacterium]
MAKAKQAIDPFTLEIIKEGLGAIGDEMFVTMQRTSMSTIIYEVLDYAVGLTDAKGNLITQGNGVTLFLGTLDFGARSVLDKFGAENLKPGDIYITNDPYSGGGTHLSDVSILAPIFYEGRLVAFAANKGHWTEVGGMAAGSWTTNSTEVYQEGLQFPCIKLFDQGEPIQSLLDIIRANVRTPDMSIGDMYAQVASMRIAERRFQEMCSKYGVDLVLRGIDALLDYGEQLTRQELKKLPDGVYEAVDTIDDDGIGNGPFEVRVKVTVAGDRLICDFTGTHGQVPGPVNCARTGLYSAARAVLMALTDPSIPASEGCFRALEVICPDRTIFTCSRPAPVSTYWETMLYAADLIWKAMARVLPDRLPAGHFLSVCGTIVAGPHPDTGELFLLVEPQAGGWGAGADKDGENGLVCVGDGETYIIPVEVCETRYGVLVDQFGFDIADGGAGKFRGGRGLVRDYRITAKEAWFTGTFGRFKYLPWGMQGGAQGSRNYTKLIFADGREPEVFGKAAQYHLRQGDVARLITGSGGGHGNPLERPVDKIQEDVKNAYITLEQAEKEYGVSLDPESLEVREVVGGRKR